MNDDGASSSTVTSGLNSNARQTRTSSVELILLCRKLLDSHLSGRSDRSHRGLSVGAY